VSESEIELFERNEQNATELRNAMSALFDPDMDFRKLLGEATARTHTFRLVEKDDLIGVPHIIVGVTFRPGFVDKATGVKGDYVSVEAVVADQATLDLPPIRQGLPDTMKVFPNEPIVYNDGGTGIRRTIVQFFTDLGMVETGAGKADENPLDRPYSIWAKGSDEAESGLTMMPDGRPFRYVAARGLRKSEYQNEYTGGETATTYYLA